jgi:hypothetical protein
MPIDVHKAAGRLLKSALVGTRLRVGVYNRVSAIRCELDNWVQCEFNRAELPDELFFELYYGELANDDPLSLPSTDRERHISSLHEVKQILARYYPDCAPLRALLKQADLAITSLRSWRQ